VPAVFAAQSAADFHIIKHNAQLMQSVLHSSQRLTERRVALATHISHAKLIKLCTLILLHRRALLDPLILDSRRSENFHRENYQRRQPNYY